MTRHFELLNVPSNSLASLQLSSLKDEKTKEEFLEDLIQEYNEVRLDHYESLKVLTVLYFINCFML